MSPVFLLATSARARPLEPTDFASLGILAPATPITIDTDAATISGGASFAGLLDGRIAVFAFDDVVLDTAVTVVGRNAVALLSHGALTLGAAGSIDARATNYYGGPGGFVGGIQWNAPSGFVDRAGRGPSAGGTVDSPYIIGNDNGGGGNGGAGGSGSPFAACTAPFPCRTPPASWCASATSQGGSAGESPAVRLLGGSGGGRGVDVAYFYGGFCSGYYGGTCGRGLYSGVHHAGGGGGVVELGAEGPLTLDGTVDLRGADSRDDLVVPPHPSMTLAPFGNWGGGGGAGGSLLAHGAGGSFGGIVLAAGGAGGDGFDSGGGGGGGGWVVLSGLTTVTGAVDVSGGAGGGSTGSYYCGAEAGQDGVVTIDSDGDFLDDDEELSVYGTDPALLDSDNGGNDDGEEVHGFGTDPTWGGDDGPPPVLLATAPVAAGTTTVVEAFRMTPGFLVQLRSSPAFGASNEVAGCTQTTPTGLGAPATIEDVAIPPGRTARLDLTLPPAWTGTAYYVAVQPDSCRVSDVLTVTVP